MHPILVAGQWRNAAAEGSFEAFDPTTGESLGDAYPVSGWEDCEQALAAADAAAAATRGMSGEVFGGFLEAYAQRLEDAAPAICQMAARETALPVSPRLADVEMPRTTDQLRQAAAAAKSGSWRRPEWDAERNIGSCFGPLGPVFVLGPNNFPLAFNPISGGDFASAIAAGNPVIAKSHPAHPGTTRLLAEQAAAAADESSLPAGFVQLLHGVSPQDGCRTVADPRTAALAFTGSRRGGLALKAAADAAGKPAYLEMSGANPVMLLPDALAERGEELIAEVAGSCLLAAGQFCTGPKLLGLLAGKGATDLIDALRADFAGRPPAVVLAESVVHGLGQAVSELVAAGAELLAGGQPVSEPGFRCPPTLLSASAEQVLANPEAFDVDLFGPATLTVVASDETQLLALAEKAPASLAASIYSAADGSEESLALELMKRLRLRAGRLINDGMPTGVAVSPAMNHGGPYPSTGHPGFSAVGMPVSIHRFAKLDCYDRVRPDRLPDCLRAAAGV
ncbi:MAG: aldehyde dehydrogenase family protein [Planctomycetota bacterium]